MIFITEEQVRESLPMRDAIGRMRETFSALRSGTALNQPRRRLALPTGSVLHSLAGAFGRYFGTKIYATHPKYGANFFLLLFDAETARPLAQMGANYLGQIRTGAASGYATDLLADPGATTLAIIGAGFQAQSQLEAIRAVRKRSRRSRSGAEANRSVRVLRKRTEPSRSVGRRSRGRCGDCSHGDVLQRSRDRIELDFRGRAHQRHGLESGAAARATLAACGTRDSDCRRFHRAIENRIRRSVASASGLGRSAHCRAGASGPTACRRTHHDFQIERIGSGRCSRGGAGI